MPFERFEGPRYTPPIDAQKVLLTARAPFQLNWTKPIPGGINAMVLFDSAGLEPLSGFGTSQRMNGESHDFLIFSAIREAVGNEYLLSAVLVDTKQDKRDNQAICDILDPAGRRIRSEAPTIENALTEGLAAANLIFEYQEDQLPYWVDTNDESSAALNQSQPTKNLELRSLTKDPLTKTDLALYSALEIERNDFVNPDQVEDPLFRKSITRVFGPRFLQGEEWSIYEKLAKRVKRNWKQNQFVPDQKELSNSVIRLGALLIPLLEVLHEQSRNFQKDHDLIGRRVANSMVAIYCAAPKSDGMLHMNLGEKTAVINGIFDKMNADLATEK